MLFHSNSLQLLQKKKSLMGKLYANRKTSLYRPIESAPTACGEQPYFACFWGFFLSLFHRSLSLAIHIFTHIKICAWCLYFLCCHSNKWKYLDFIQFHFMSSVLNVNSEKKNWSFDMNFVTFRFTIFTWIHWVNLKWKCSELLFKLTNKSTHRGTLPRNWQRKMNKLMMDLSFAKEKIRLFWTRVIFRNFTAVTRQFLCWIIEAITQIFSRF